MSSESFASAIPLNEFSTTLIRWQKQAGRHDLPWQHANPYQIWVSEIMLQQTQVSTVLNYYPRFMARFPNVQSLAHASIDEVTALWAGLGYYSRARNLHAAAQQIQTNFAGVLPRARQQLQQLKGIGRSTAAAIAALAYHQREAILDGNVKRVLCRVFALFGNPQSRAFEDELWQLAERLLPKETDDMPAYTQGLMDLGATLCTRQRPQCSICPMEQYCLAHQQQLTAILPERKLATLVQAMPVMWLCAINSAGELFLLKRAEQGIWGQLYCPPMVDSNEWPSVLQQLRLTDAKLDYHTPITHRLTHRAMSITPCVLHMTDVPASWPWSGRFYCLQDALALGIPKPLTDLLPHLLTPSNKRH